MNEPPPSAKIWYLALNAIPVEEGDRRAATATMWTTEGSTEWRPIHELAGYRQQAPPAEPGRKQKPGKGKSSSQGKFPNSTH